MRRYITVAALLLALVMGLSGCLDSLVEPDRSNPLDPLNPNTISVVPARPTGLTAVVSDRLVELSWSVGNASTIDHYRIYRADVEDGENENYELIDTTTETAYADADVRNGQAYYYKVSGVNDLGLEGEASREIIVIPRMFSVTIDQGNPKTSSRNVALRMSASAETEIMQISNAPDMSGAQWLPYQSTYSWSLPGGDGDKTVYVRFRDAADNESDIVSDSIELDTRAVIESVTEDSDGEDLSPGDVIHFTLTAGEIHGEATVDLGTLTRIALYDDGTGGQPGPEGGGPACNRDGVETVTYHPTNSGNTDSQRHSGFLSTHIIPGVTDASLASGSSTIKQKKAASPQAFQNTMELVCGLEPQTCSLRVSCSTS